MLALMMSRDEAWERKAVIEYADKLKRLLEAGQDVDVEIEGFTLRSRLADLRAEIDRALA
jgi:hypothetical protein